MSALLLAVPRFASFHLHVGKRLVLACKADL